MLVLSKKEHNGLIYELFVDEVDPATFESGRALEQISMYPQVRVTPKPSTTNPKLKRERS